MSEIILLNMILFLPINIVNTEVDLVIVLQNHLQPLKIYQMGFIAGYSIK